MASENETHLLKSQLPYRVLGFTLAYAWMCTLIFAIFVFFTKPVPINQIDAGLLVGLAAWILAIRFFVYANAKTIRDLEVSALLLLLPIIGKICISIIFLQHNDGVAEMLTILITASLAISSNAIYWSFATVSVGLLIISRSVAGAPVTFQDCMHLLVMAPTASVIMRTVLGANYNTLFQQSQDEGRLRDNLKQSKDQLSSELQRRQRTEVAFRKQQAQLNALLETAPLILNLIDRDGKIQVSKGSGLDALGLAENELADHSLFVLQKDQPALLKAFENAIGGMRTAVRASLAEGVYHEILYQPVFDGLGNVDAVMEVAVDVSEKVIGESERKNLESRFVEARKMESLGSLAAGVAHDFNNYLMAIVAFSESASSRLENKTHLDEADIKKLQRVAVEVRKTAINAAGVCQQMLMYAGKARESKALCDINKILTDSEQFLSASLPPKVTLSLDVTDRKLKIIADDLLIQRAIFNVVKNAGDAIGGLQSGTISIKTSIRAVTESELTDYVGVANFNGNQSFCCIEIRDDGVGIDVETINRIFDPYFSTKSNGHGFGLAITNGIITSHSGFIRCTSQLGIGTTFEILLPLAAEMVDAEESGSQDPPPVLVSRHLLIVDDESAVRRSVQLVLESFNHQVILAENGNEALEILRETNQEFDCVILDFSMPEMDGMEVLRAMRDQSIDVPVILCSGHMVQADTNDGPQPEDYLAKPYEANALQDAIERVCSSPAKP